MADRKKKRTRLDATGIAPIVNYFCLCEKALNEKDNVISLIRIVDTFYIAKLPVKGELPSGAIAVIEFTIAIGLKPGRARERHEVGLRLERPSGEREEFGTRWPVVFDDDYTGANFLFRTMLAPKQLGTHKFHLLFDGSEVSSVAFRLLVPESASES